MRLSRTSLCGLVGMGAALVVALWMDPGRQARVTALGVEDGLPGESVASASFSRSEASAVPERTAIAATPEAAPAAQPESAREFLSEFYGERWPEIEARIAATGQDLDRPYFFTPWEDVAAEFESRIGMNQEAIASLVQNQLHWTEELTPEFVHANFPLGESQEIDASDVASIADLVADKNRQVTELAEHYGAMIDAYVHEKWRMGDYLHAPFTTEGLNSRRGFHSEAHGGRGWSVAITLTREEYPEFTELEDRMVELVHERSELVVGYLRAKFVR